MNKDLLRVLILVVIVLAFSVFLPQLVADAHPAGQPPIPHSLEGRTECVACHSTGVAGAPKYPADHAGRTNEMCVICHKQGEIQSSVPTTVAPPSVPPATATHPAATTATQAAQSGGPPRIPHPLQGRDNCLACHSTGVAGAPQVPATHTGRTNDLCRTCHQSAQPAQGEAPRILPTPILHPTVSAQTQNSCVTCHTSQSGALSAIVKDWAASIHAERGVGCQDCHGGDASQPAKEEAMSAKAGFIGTPKTGDIPALCASCHARVDWMRQYDLPTDQWSKYQQSVHGQKLAQGDTQVATCFVCHDGHGTKKTNDPTAKVYALNVPELCASCHANAELMKAYNIPTNQYDLYKKSVHGVALLEKQDLRAPSCATCHGTHGAAPPGFEEAANVCGSCHTATQNYYLQSKHASNAPGTPKCVTCHGRYDVMTPTDAMFTDEGTRTCGSCHLANSAQAPAIRDLADNIRASAAAIDNAATQIKIAAGSALIVAPEEAKLAEAKTNLITARAAQHTLNQTTVKERTDKALAKAKEVSADAQKAIDDSIFRRQFMVFGLAIMALAIASLWIVRRELYKQLPPK